MNVLNLAWRALAALVLALALVPVVFAQSGTAKVRVIHASPDAPAVDVFVNGNRTLSNVPFFTASDYLDLAPGSYRLQIAPAGQPASAAVIDATATFQAGKAYSVAATGPVAAIKPTVIEDNLSAPASGNAKVRVYHFSPDAPAVDVKVANGATLISNLAFPDASAYLDVPAGAYNLQVTPAGGSAVVIDLANTTLEAGKIYSVFATNVVAQITPQVAVTTPVATPGTLPATSAGATAPLALLAGVAAALLGMAVLLRRRAAL